MADIVEIIKRVQYDADFIAALIIEDGIVTVEITKNRGGELDTLVYSDFFGFIEHFPDDIQRLGL